MPSACARDRCRGEQKNTKQHSRWSCPPVLPDLHWYTHWDVLPGRLVLWLRAGVVVALWLRAVCGEWRGGVAAWRRKRNLYMDVFVSGERGCFKFRNVFGTTETVTRGKHTCAVRVTPPPPSLLPFSAGSDRIDYGWGRKIFVSRELRGEKRENVINCESITLREPCCVNPVSP